MKRRGGPNDLVRGSGPVHGTKYDTRSTSGKQRPRGSQDVKMPGSKPSKHLGGARKRPDRAEGGPMSQKPPHAISGRTDGMRGDRWREPGGHARSETVMESQQPIDCYGDGVLEGSQYGQENSAPGPHRGR